jgi:hypothetical protein
MTFGTTNISYYVVTEPIYQEIDSTNQESVVRTGRVIANKPTIITPTYAMSLDGFSQEAYQYLQHISQQYGPNSPGILYQYKKQEEKVEIVGGQAPTIAQKISSDLDNSDDNMSVVMVGVDELWDVALLKFMYEFTSSSSTQNVREFQNRGLLEPQPGYDGTPQAAIQKIQQLFYETERGGDPDTLKRELDRWGLFKHFQDRFLDLFRNKR